MAIRGCIAYWYTPVIGYLSIPWWLVPYDSKSNNMGHYHTIFDLIILSNILIRVWWLTRLLVITSFLKNQLLDYWLIMELYEENLHRPLSSLFLSDWPGQQLWLTLCYTHSNSTSYQGPRIRFTFDIPALYIMYIFLDSDLPRSFVTSVLNVGRMMKATRWSWRWNISPSICPPPPTTVHCIYLTAAMQM